MVNTRQMDERENNETGVTRDFLNDLIAPLAKLSDIEPLVSRIDNLEKKIVDLENRYEDRFLALEQILAAKEDKIESLSNENKELSSKLVELVNVVSNDRRILSRQVEQLESYGRRMCLRMDNIHTQLNETSKQLKTKVLGYFKKMDVDIRHSDIDRIHRIGRKHTNKRNIEIQQVILRMNSWEKRCEAYDGRKVARAKKLGVFISLDLTKHRYKLLEKAKEVVDLDAGDYCYADINCRIAVNINNHKYIVEDESDLEQLIDEMYEPIEKSDGEMPDKKQ